MYKTISFYLAGIMFGFLGGIFCINLINKDKSNKTKTQNDILFYEEIINKASIFLNEGDVVLSEALWQAALSSASRKPESISFIWNKYKDILEHSIKLKLSEQEKLARAISFSGQFGNILGGCENEESLNNALAVYVEINQYIEEKAKLISEIISKKLSEIKDQEIKNISPHVNIKKIADILMEINDDTNLIAVANKNPDVALVLKNAMDKIPWIFAIAEKEIKEMNTNLDQMRKVDRDKLTEPSPDGQGPCQLIFDSLDKMDSSLGDLSSSGLAETAKFAEGLQTLRVQSQNVKKKIYQTQVIRYNLWAVSALTSLTKDSDVAGTLAAIDQSLLHNSVSSIYSITYDAYIRAEKNAQIKYESVGRILKDKKKDLSNF